MYFSFGLPAFIVWGIAGTALHAVPDSIILRGVIACVALVAGGLEAAGRRAPILSTGWQVPRTWVASDAYWRRSLVWGVFLGPGFATRNPLAGTWLLAASLIPLTHALGLAAFSVGGVVGVVQSAGRVAGIRRQIRTRKIDQFEGIIREMHARRVDGIALVLLGVFLFASVAVA